MRLSVQLCDGEPSKRLYLLSSLEKEFTSIERKLLFGENIFDKMGYSCKWIWYNLKAGCSSLFYWGWKHKFMACLILLIMLGFAYYLWPKKPFDIAMVKNDTYMIPSKGFSMKIPTEWIPLTKQTLEKLQNADFSSTDKPTWVSSELISLLKNSIKQGMNMIMCDIDRKFTDNVVIQPGNLAGHLLDELSIDELEVLTKQMYKEEVKTDVEIYEIKKVKVAGYPCVRIYASFNPKEFRSLTYIFMRENDCISVTLTAKNHTFQKQREIFDNIIGTVRLKK